MFENISQGLSTFSISKTSVKYSIMKFSLQSLVLLTCFASVAIADVIPSYILYYPGGTPEATKAEAKDIILKSGGQILYEYSKFFAQKVKLHHTRKLIRDCRVLEWICRNHTKGGHGERQKLGRPADQRGSREPSRWEVWV